MPIPHAALAQRRNRAAASPTGDSTAPLVNYTAHRFRLDSAAMPKRPGFNHFELDESFSRKTVRLLSHNLDDW